jgi:transcriptional regulator with XRE-family HTH domain
MREERGWTQPHLAQLLGERGLKTHATTVAKIEAGTRSVRINEAVALADLLDVSLDSLLGRRRFTADEWLTEDLRALHGVTDRYAAELATVSGEVSRRMVDSGVSDIPPAVLDDVNALGDDFDSFCLELDTAAERLRDIRDRSARILHTLTHQEGTPQ